MRVQDLEGLSGAISEEKSLAKEYQLNDEGSYILQTAYPVPGVGKRLCFDATRRLKDVGRLINHSASRYNIKPGKPPGQVAGGHDCRPECGGGRRAYL